MSNDTQDTSSDLMLVPTDSALGDRHLNELAQSLVEFKLSANDAATNAQQELRRLHRQIWWLRGGLVIILLMITGLAAWSVWQLRVLEQQAVTRSQQGEVTASGTTEQIGKLEQQVLNLEQRLDQEAESAKTVKAQMENVQADLQQRQKAIGVLAKSLQELVTESPTATPAATSAVVGPTLPASPQPTEVPSSTALP